jgi:UrcA family protein
VNAFIKSIPVLALSALVLGSLPASAATRGVPADTLKVTVRFADLDLARPQDAEVLYQRIQFAARLVCTDSSAPWDGRRSRNWIRCFNGVVEDAVRGIDQPLLTALYRARARHTAG